MPHFVCQQKHRNWLLIGKHHFLIHIPMPLVVNLRGKKKTIKFSLAHNKVSKFFMPIVSVHSYCTQKVKVKDQVQVVFKTSTVLQFCYSLKWLVTAPLFFSQSTEFPDFLHFNKKKKNRKNLYVRSYKLFAFFAELSYNGSFLRIHMDVQE